MGPGCVHRQRLRNDQKTRSAMTGEWGMTRAVGRNPAAGGRDWVVGDVHGCFRTLRDALLAIDFDDGRERTLRPRRHGRERDHDTRNDHSRRDRRRHRVRYARSSPGPAGSPANCRTTCGHAGCNRSAGTGRLRAAAEQTAGIECHKDAGVIDDIPGAYKPIDDVMEHENGLAVPVHRLRQVLNIKG